MSKNTFTQYHLQDQIRLVKKLIPPMPKLPSSGNIEHRYEELNGDFNIRSWRDDGREKTSKGAVDDRPEWLTTIINVAIVGEQLQRVPHPPPDVILWFTTDAKRNLIEFTDFTN
jgi:hypothetical protein